MGGGHAGSVASGRLGTGRTDATRPAGRQRWSTPGADAATPPHKVTDGLPHTWLSPSTAWAVSPGTCPAG
jgi:hypothetical protein